jgi:hypothetical protein
VVSAKLCVVVADLVVVSAKPCVVVADLVVVLAKPCVVVANSVMVSRWEKEVLRRLVNDRAWQRMNPAETHMDALRRCVRFPSTHDDLMT